MLIVAQSRSPGKERDADTGLDNFGARYYGSSLVTDGEVYFVHAPGRGSKVRRASMRKSSKQFGKQFFKAVGRPIERNNGAGRPSWLTGLWNYWMSVRPKVEAKPKDAEPGAHPPKQSPCLKRRDGSCV